VVGIVAAMIVTWFIVSVSRVDHWIGAEGVITQLLGFLLAALAVKSAALEFANCFCSDNSLAPMLTFLGRFFALTLAGWLSQRLPLTL